MAQMFGLARLGRDAEVRFTQSGEAVANLSLAFSYGRKGDDGNRPTQWVDGSLWGKRAEALSQYLKKGGLISVTLDDVHIETFEGKNGQAHKLVGSVTQVELAGGGSQTASSTQRQSAPAPQRPAAKPAPNFSDMDDDIPF